MVPEHINERSAVLKFWNAIDPKAHKIGGKKQTHATRIATQCNVILMKSSGKAAKLQFQFLCFYISNQILMSNCAIFILTYQVELWKVKYWMCICDMLPHHSKLSHYIFQFKKNLSPIKFVLMLVALATLPLPFVLLSFVFALCCLSFLPTIQKFLLPDCVFC